MTSAKYDFCLGQGTDVDLPFVLRDASGQALNLTGYKARMQMRRSIYDKDAVDTLTTENGRIRIDHEEGRITCTFPNAQTESYPAQTLVYDLEVVEPDNRVKRVVGGRITVTPEVTRIE